ncbi:MAG: hypothetical protein OXR73_04935 [Myxococcales bacterium]|nr:hypothetical protein [Myxococcales bacterium]
MRGTRPRLCFLGHHHQRVGGVLHGVPCFGLSIVGRPASMVAIEVAPERLGFSVLGEWPQASTG